VVNFIYVCSSMFCLCLLYVYLDDGSCHDDEQLYDQTNEKCNKIVRGHNYSLHLHLLPSK
jgi:hypothetical protein